MSREAINSKIIGKHNFSLFTSESETDNLLLEMRLALELKEMAMISKIFPVMIGNNNRLICIKSTTNMLTTILILTIV